MSGFAKDFDGDATRQNARTFSGRGETAAHVVPFAAMILDSAGTVLYCHADAARLFRAGAHTLFGRHVSELIPGLPFHPMTPGYNVAFAAFWAPDGPLHRFCGVDSEGRSFELQVSLDKMKLKEDHQILLSLRLPLASAQPPE